MKKHDINRPSCLYFSDFNDVTLTSEDTDGHYDHEGHAVHDDHVDKKSESGNNKKSIGKKSKSENNKKVERSHKSGNCWDNLHEK